MSYINNKNMVNFMYVNECIIDCRLRGIYQQISLGRYEKAAFNIIEMLINLKNKNIVDIEPVLYNEIVTEFIHMRVEICLKKYHKVHDRVRNLHYKLIYID